MSITRFRPTPAFVLAIVALMVALGGSAVAAGRVPNSDKSKHIANGQVKKQDLGANSVRGEKVLDGSITGLDLQDASVGGADVQDGSLEGADVKDGSLTGADVQDDSLTGADIQEGTLGLMSNQVRMVSNTTANQPNGVGATISVNCPANEKAIGGSAAWIIPGTNDPTALQAPITASLPIPATGGVNNATGWTAAGRNLSGVDRQLRVYAICVPQ
jgi:uncharacterized protein YjbI with pentapeptide repeats